MIHQAGALTDEGVQRCTRCGTILVDYRGSMVEDGSPPLSGFEEGASIEVLYAGVYSGVTDKKPDCEATH